LAELKNSISWRVASEAVTVVIASLAVIGTFENIANIKFSTFKKYVCINPSFSTNFVVHYQEN
jgi:hypothetical protein